MSEDIIAVASALKDHHLQLELSTRLAKTAKDAVEVESEAMLKLLDSASVLFHDPALGSLIDLKV